MHATRHAVKRFQQRVENISAAEARRRLEELAGHATCQQRGIQSRFIARIGEKALTLIVDSGSIITVY